jgi:hypothetical protein
LRWFRIFFPELIERKGFERKMRIFHFFLGKAPKNLVFKDRGIDLSFLFFLGLNWSGISELAGAAEHFGQKKALPKRARFGGCVCVAASPWHGLATWGERVVSSPKGPP